MLISFFGLEFQLAVLFYRVNGGGYRFSLLLSIMANTVPTIMVIIPIINKMTPIIMALNGVKVK